MTGRGGYVFVSYARSDAAYVRRLVAFLRRAGVMVWTDTNVEAGGRWRRTIMERIDGAGALVVVMSPAAGVSEWVAEEVDRARSLGKPVLPVLLAGEVIFGMGQRQHEDVKGGRTPSAAFVARLRDLTARSEQPPRRPQYRELSYLVGIVPNPADCFQHRELVDRLDAAVAGSGTAIVTGVADQGSGRPRILSGLGGVGKTQLAADLARRLREHGAINALVWITATDREAVLNGYAEAAHTVLGIEPGDPQAAATALLGWLSATTDAWLIVLDDVTQPAVLDGLWPPTSLTGRVVVTTRRRDAAMASHGRIVQVGLFTPADANAYLSAKLADRPDHLDGADGLVDDLGYLPLALAQAAAYIVNKDITCAEYRRRFADQRRRLDSLTPASGQLPDDYPTPVAAAWALSIAAANQLDPAGLALSLLTGLSMLDPNEIPAPLVRTPAMLAYLTKHRTTTGSSPVPSVDEEQATDAIACLAQLNLADTTTEPGGDRRVRVHALVQRATRDQTNEKAQTAAVDAVAQALVEYWPQIERNAALGQALRANAAALRCHGEDRLWCHGAHPLLFRIGRSLGEAGLVTAAIEHSQHLTYEAARRLGPDHPDTLTTRDNLAYWRGEAFDAAGAVAAFEDLLADRLRVLGRDHPDTLTTRNNLAYWRGEAGDPAGAAAAFEDLLADRLRVLGPDHPDTLTTRNNLARWRGQAGDPAGAATVTKDLLADRLQVLGPDNPITLTTRNNLAYWRGQAGDAAGAVAAIEELLADYLRVLGPNHPDTLATRINLGCWYGRAGDPAGAVAAFEDLVADHLRVLGPDHPETLATRYDLAYWQGQAGDPAGAAAALEELLADYLRVLGPDHPDTLITRNLARGRGQAEPRLWFSRRTRK
jgi:hypothetical protein